MNTKGIILAGGSGTRLSPLTSKISKHLLPIYDKPMIFYPLSILMLAGIKEILIITNPEYLESFKGILGDGSFIGIDIEYETQENPNGVADALIIGERFIDKDNVCLILGDNFFWGNYFSALLCDININFKKGAHIFSYTVRNPKGYGIVEMNKNNVISIEEKPQNPKSSLAITGLYFYDNDCVKKAKQIKPSVRNEIEITDINKLYLDKNNLKCTHLGRGFTWLDVGTYENLLSASTFVHTIEERQGFKIACIEEIALSKGWITKDSLLNYIKNRPKSDYYDYIKAL